MNSAQPIITVEGLGKRYLIEHKARNDTLRDTLAQGMHDLAQRVRGRRRVTGPEEFWALRDVSFTIERAEVVGIIGRNGAGKSTLLKLLSRITEPTTGRIRLRGRVASLLEVGTGFHPDLSGRENIFLNGAILGMSRGEILRKFDEIVAFAEVDQFLDTPVRRYSSGMRMRLAFAVAAHLDPEILIVDEVLAVGDADFQRKCLRKMNDVTRNEGRTILFVSHQLSAVQQLCRRALLLDQGRLAHDTDVASGIAAYCAQSAELRGREGTLRLGPDIELTRFELSPVPARVFEDIEFHLEIRPRADCTLHDLHLIVQDEQRLRVALADLRHAAKSYRLAAGKPFQIQGRLKRLALLPGTYFAGLHVRTSAHADDHEALRTFEVQPAAAGGLLAHPRELLGSVALDVEFAVQGEGR